jgi:uncharacterized protein involved in response to NO
LGRLSLLLVQNPIAAVAVIDLGFYPALAAVLLPYVKPSDMKAERVFILHFSMYFCGNFLMHLDAPGLLAGYVLLVFACLIRVFTPLFRAASFNNWMALSGSLWIMAFAMFVLIYAPMLVTARIDGRDG